MFARWPFSFLNGKFQPTDDDDLIVCIVGSLKPAKVEGSSASALGRLQVQTCRIAATQSSNHRLESWVRL